MPDTDLLTEPQAARLLGVSAKTLYRWRKAGAVGHVLTPGHKIRCRPKHIARLLADMEVEPILGPTSLAVS